MSILNVCVAVLILYLLFELFVFVVTCIAKSRMVKITGGVRLNDTLRNILDDHLCQPQQNNNAIRTQLVNRNNNVNNVNGNAFDFMNNDDVDDFAITAATIIANLIDVDVNDNNRNIIINNFGTFISRVILTHRDRPNDNLIHRRWNDIVTNSVNYAFQIIVRVDQPINGNNVNGSRIREISIVAMNNNQAASMYTLYYNRLLPPQQQNAQPANAQMGAPNVQNNIINNVNNANNVQNNNVNNNGINNNNGIHAAHPANPRNRRNVIANRRNRVGQIPVQMDPPMGPPMGPINMNVQPLPQHEQNNNEQP